MIRKDDHVEVGGFPVSSLPESIRDLVVHGSTVQSVDPAFWGTLALPVAAGCVGATRCLQITPDWLEPSVVWATVIAPSGSGKSAPMRALLAPVRAVDRQLHEQGEAMALTFAAAQAARRKGEAGPPPPPQLAAIVSDITMEGLAVRLKDNPRGLLLAVDELAGWLRSHDRYRSGGGDEQAWLSIHGAQPIRVDRKTSGSIFIPHPAVSICGTIQDRIARQYLAGQERRASGTSARVLLAAPPIMAARLSEGRIPEEVTQAYSRTIRALLDLRFDDDGDPVSLTLTDAAKERFRVWHDRNGDACIEAANAGEEDIAAALAKLRGYVPRLALLFGLCRAAQRGMAELLRQVEECDIESAIEVVDWFEGEARRLYREWDTWAAGQRGKRHLSVEEMAEKLFLLLEGRGEMPLDDLHTATGRNHPAELLRAALMLLKAAGRADTRKVTVTGRGRPRELWWALPRA